MRGDTSDMNSRWLVGAALVALLAGCGRKPETPPPAVPPPQTPAADAAPAAEPVAQAVATTAAPATTASSQPAARATATAAGASAAASEPALSTMQLATMTSKMGVPVDLRYQFDGDALSGQPVTLHLAAVPSVAGTTLSVSIKQEPGVEFVKEAMVQQKITADTAYRQQLSVRRLADGPQELRVLVTMEMPIGSAFGYFSVPFQPAPSAPAPGRKSYRQPGQEPQ